MEAFCGGGTTQDGLQGFDPRGRSAEHDLDRIRIHRQMQIMHLRQAFRGALQIPAQRPFEHSVMVHHHLTAAGNVKNSHRVRAILVSDLQDPAPPFAAITFPSPVAPPPMVLLLPVMKIPDAALPRSAPLLLVPTKLPWNVLSPTA